MQVFFHNGGNFMNHTLRAELVRISPQRRSRMEVDTPVADCASALGFQLPITSTLCLIELIVSFKLKLMWHINSPPSDCKAPRQIASPGGSPPRALWPGRCCHLAAPEQLRLRRTREPQEAAEFWQGQGQPIMLLKELQENKLGGGIFISCGTKSKPY